ncbi:uncharacterized protein CPUR_06678 [Claviceps purpurea 20.1]|uniref:RNA polymerase I-specific transcription initiation factor RRN6-like protein n=1 Tax=Claviceps purpurea (strain 20.1) TaxID=1111077 RepID=M1WEI5_CLAP2|nr:uncharacterized protein CPUR_06678 [Claviceps purpurea 20.1]
MAESRRLADLHLGQPGLLTYIPSDGPDRPGILHSARITSHAPRFNIVGTTANLYAPSRPGVPNPSSKLHKTLRVQGRYLLNSHPEACIGGPAAFSDILKDSLSRSKHSDDLQDQRDTLAMGDVTDAGPNIYTTTPLLAVVTGASGQKLRLVVANKSQWQWGEHEDALLHLSVMDISHQENETIWTGDGLPIVNVKFVTTWWQTARARWLLVQTQSTVTLLQPELHSVPVPQHHADSSSDAFQPPSFIAPNRLIVLDHKDIGGNGISDVWFIPASIGSLPQLGVIDQCGYWSIWTLMGTWQVNMNTLRLSLYKCGHICDGVLPSIPPHTTHPAQRHGMLLIGQTCTDDSSDLPSMPEQDSKDRIVSSPHYFLIWNAGNLVLLDLETEKIIQKLDIVRQSRLAPDWIIGVEQSPANPRHVFVLTARQIIWLDLALTQGAAETVVLRPTLLLACSHVGFDNEDYRMSTCRASEDNGSSTMVFIHSPNVGQLTVYWFGLAPETQLPQYHRHMTSLSSAGQHSAINKAQLIKVWPAKLEDDPQASDENMNTLLMKRKTINIEVPNQDAAKYEPRPKLLKVDGIMQEISSQLSSAIDRGACGLPTDMIAFIRNTFDHCTLENGTIPLTSWMQLFSNAEEPIAYDPLSDSMEPDMWELLRSTGNSAIVTQLRRRDVDGNEPSSSVLEYSSLVKQFSDFWLQSAPSLPQEMQLVRLIWVCEVARDFYLSSYGCLVQDVPLLEPFLEAGTSSDAERHAADDITQQSSHRSTQPDIKFAASSPAEPVSSPGANEAAEPVDAAFQRLRLLCPTLTPGTLGPLKPPKVLSYWPSERGVDTDDYISSVALAEEAKFSHIKERRRRVESRKRAQSEKYKLPPMKRPIGETKREEDTFVDLTQRRTPAMQIMSSQQAVPGSSQSFMVAGPSVAMSQPVSGVFGDRKVVKKGKRKSGFR